MNERFRIIIVQLRSKVNELDSKTWFVIRSILTAIERDHDLNKKDSEAVDNILKALLKEAHELTTGPRWSDAREYQKR